MTAPTIDAVLRVELARARAEIAELREANGLLREANGLLDHRATHDGLTGLLNREGLADAWSWQVHATDAVALLDLDRFKEINDTFGHPAGDVVLAHVAEALTRRYRIVARLGGDEVVIVDNKHRIADIGGEPLSWAVRVDAVTTVTVTATVGITRAVPESQTLTLARADRAMYRAKAAARGSSAWWCRDLDPHLRLVDGLAGRPAVRQRDARGGVA